MKTRSFATILVFALAGVLLGAADKYTTHNLPLPGAPPDGVGMDYIAFDHATGSVWVPAGNTGAVDVATLHDKATLTLDGDPEGFAVDGKRHRFYTNLEDKDKTLAIDLTSHKTVATWNPACGEGGPHGLRLDEGNGHLFVACSAKL